GVRELARNRPRGHRPAGDAHDRPRRPPDDRREPGGCSWRDRISAFPAARLANAAGYCLRLGRLAGGARRVPGDRLAADRPGADKRLGLALGRRLPGPGLAALAVTGVLALMGALLAWFGASILVLADARRGFAFGLLLVAAGLSLERLAEGGWQPALLLAAGGLAAGLVNSSEAETAAALAGALAAVTLCAMPSLPEAAGAPSG